MRRERTGNRQGVAYPSSGTRGSASSDVTACDDAMTLMASPGDPSAPSMQAKGMLEGGESRMCREGRTAFGGPS